MTTTKRDVGIDNSLSIYRKGHLCKLNEIGDEFHYLFKCQNVQTTFISKRLCRTPYVYTLKKCIEYWKKKLLLALGNVYTKVLESVKHPPDWIHCLCIYWLICNK